MSLPLALALLGAAPAAPAQGVAAMTTTDPVEMFQQYCLEARQYSPKTYKPARYADLPRSALQAFSLALTDLTPPFEVQMLAEQDLIGPMVTAEPGGEIFAKYYAYSKEPLGGASAECAVIWHKADFARASAAVRHMAGAHEGEAITHGDFPHILYRVDGLTFGAAEHDGWTVLHIANPAVSHMQ